MQEVINEWLEDMRKDFCCNECPVRRMIDEVSEYHENKIVGIYCNGCLVNLFLEKITK